MNRLCIFAHFDKHDLIDDYVIYYLEDLRRAGCHIVFVSTSKLSHAALERLALICGAAIVRQNVGYDFGSWRAGLETITDMQEYDEVVLCNDSVYGPLFPIADVFRDMEQKTCDFWGITCSQEMAHHLQSYFLVFRRSVAGSGAFRDFWKTVKPEHDKTAVIKKYEIGLTQVLLKAGFELSLYAPCVPSPASIARKRAISLFKRNPLTSLRKWVTKGVAFGGTNVNVTHFFWRELIRDWHAPFVKIELLRDNPMKIGIRSFEAFLRLHSSYPLSLIINHLNRVKPETR